MAGNAAPGFAQHPGHTITVTPFAGTIRVLAGGSMLAESSSALELREAQYPPVLYIPFADIAFDLLVRTETATHCPFKGMASYWRLAAEPGKGDVLWAYEAPYDEMTAIAGHGAFYGNKVRVETA